ncbi:MAG: adenylyltransferase/cytidyltransferase family protein, partial [Bacteroidales bacterium]|nr:adenylyltransferase/cytidyltransferase family protein [Bacteroidales bacterium]
MRHLVVAMGAFDGVHLGHQALIHQVLTIAERDHLTSGVVTFEPHPQLVLHPERPFRLITLEREKELLLHQMGIEQVAVIPFTAALSQMSAEEFLRTYLDEQLHIHTLVVGFDHHFGHDKGL